MNKLRQTAERLAIPALTLATLLGTATLKQVGTEKPQEVPAAVTLADQQQRMAEQLKEGELMAPADRLSPFYMEQQWGFSNETVPAASDDAAERTLSDMLESPYYEAAPDSIPSDKERSRTFGDVQSGDTGAFKLP